MTKFAADMDDDANRMTELLRGKVVRLVRRHRPSEVLIEFEDGSRLYVNNVPNGLEFSVT